MKKRRNRGKNGKTVGNGSISKTRNSGRISVIWLLLAVVVAVSLTVGACALWLPDRAPALLGSAKEITSAPAGVQEYTGATQVTMIPTVSQTRELVGNASGTVTEDMSSQGLTSGKTAMKVNGVSVVALVTATPMYRDLATGDKGDDVLALNNELARLGLPASAKSTTYTWNTSQGVKQLMSAAGNTSDGSLPLTDVLWIPAASVRVGEWAGTVGATVAGGSVVGKVPGSVTKFSIQNGQPSELDRTVTLIGQTATLKAGTTEVDDAEFCARVAATQEFQSLTRHARHRSGSQRAACESGAGAARAGRVGDRRQRQQGVHRLGWQDHQGVNCRIRARGESRRAPRRRCRGDHLG